jgi:tetratricopeptide (TPR) repeat protein
MKMIFFMAGCLLITACNSFSNTDYLLKKGDEAKAKLDFPTAINSYSKAIKLNPKLAKAYAGRGFVESMKGDLLAATKDFDIAISLNLKDTAVFYRNGVDKCVLEDYTSAITVFTLAITIAPNYADAYFERARAELNINSLNNALKDINKAITLKPSDMQGATILRGTIKLSSKDTTGGCKDYFTASVMKKNESIDSLIKWHCLVKYPL